MAWEEYFNRMKDYHFKVTYHSNTSNDVEEMYQAFKARLIAELYVNSDELLYSAELFDHTKD